MCALSGFPGWKLILLTLWMMGECRALKAFSAFLVSAIVLAQTPSLLLPLLDHQQSRDLHLCLNSTSCLFLSSNKEPDDTILKQPALRLNEALSLRPDYFFLCVC